MTKYKSNLNMRVSARSLSHLNPGETSATLPDLSGNGNDIQAPEGMTFVYDPKTKSVKLIEVKDAK